MIQLKQPELIEHAKDNSIHVTVAKELEILPWHVTQDQIKSYQMKNKADISSHLTGIRDELDWKTERFLSANL